MPPDAAAPNPSELSHGGPPATVKLGLIGDNIAQSQAPRLHRLAGEIAGINVTYDRLVPKDAGLDFDALFVHCAGAGYRGLNITYPYKERALRHLTVGDPQVAALAAVNTVVFADGGATGFNTDYSGFMAGFRHTFGTLEPGPVCLLGAGGVGKAVAFGLVELGARQLRIAERDLTKASALADALLKAAPGLSVSVTGDVAEAAAGAAGLVNCTPVGMVGYEGTPLIRPLMRHAKWAFDAVYTPVETEFLRDASAEGLATMSGYELFFFQGVHAFAIFHGRPVDEAALRSALAR